VKHRLPVAYFYFNGWDSIQLGISICWSQPNIEIHVPFGFFRFGWIVDLFDAPERHREKRYYQFGYDAYDGWHFGEVE
jgi:hypothetical protein